jgi:DNA (cytosine-5)-methyltransferase 1
MKAFGITCGVGSLLIGAKQAGFDVVGNVEFRKYYHVKDQYGQNTFTSNFPGAIFKPTITDLTPEEIERIMNPDLALGHPECGRYSQLSGSVKNRHLRAQDPGDIPLFVDLVAQIRPRFFMMDDLPKSLEAFPMSEYVKRLPDYDLFPEWISNYHYGNPQKKRERMFMIGSLREERWAFSPGEKESYLTVADVIGDLPEPRAGSNYPNHDPHDMTADCFRALNVGGYRKKNSWAELREHMLTKKSGYILEYDKADGTKALRFSFVRGHWDGPAHTITGGNAHLHYHRCDPYTIRERARIQGCPDDFVFYGTVLNDRGEWHHDSNSALVKQTGKFMPVEFGRYVSEQVAAHIEDREFKSSGQRMLPPNSFVDRAKSYYCENVGYANQERACGQCWLYNSCTIRSRKYKIGEPKVGQMDLLDPGVVPSPVAQKPRAAVVTARAPRRFAETVESYELSFEEDAA